MTLEPDTGREEGQAVFTQFLKKHGMLVKKEEKAPPQ
jgi:hypothetical protein